MALKQSYSHLGCILRLSSYFMHKLKDAGNKNSEEWDESASDTNKYWTTWNNTPLQLPVDLFLIYLYQTKILDKRKHLFLQGFFII